MAQQENARRKVTHRQIEPKKEPQKRQYRVARKRPEKPESRLKIIPLGGLTEIGKNMTVFEYELPRGEHARHRLRHPGFYVCKE